MLRNHVSSLYVINLSHEEAETLTAEWWHNSKEIIRYFVVKFEKIYVLPSSFSMFDFDVAILILCLGFDLMSWV